MSRTDLACCLVLGLWIAFVSVAAVWSIQAHMHGRPTIEIVEVVPSSYVL